MYQQGKEQTVIILIGVRLHSCVECISKKKGKRNQLALDAAVAITPQQLFVFLMLILRIYSQKTPSGEFMERFASVTKPERHGYRVIHRFSLHGFHIVLDINSGAVHMLDGAAYDVCGMMDEHPCRDCPQAIYNMLSGKYTTGDITNAYAELYSLYEQGLLFSDDRYISQAGITARIREPVIKALCLHVSHDCNMRCKYCFASTGDFGTGRRHIMTPETACKAIDFVADHSGGRKNIEIDFFGGEPLMGFETVKAAVAHAHQLEKEKNKSFRFTITTNGVLLNDEIAAYINREMSNAVLSLDGRKSVNDAVRVLADGSGSYDRIIPKFQKLVEGRGDKDYYIRGTFTAQNLDFTNDIADFLRNGFDSISVEPVVLKDRPELELKDVHLPEIFAEYEKLAGQFLENIKKGEPNPLFFHFMVDLEQGPCVVKRLRGCGAGGEYLAVTPDEELYPCHQFVGQEQFKIGTLDTGVVNHDITELFAKQSVLSRKGCSDCWAKYYCSGGCSAANYLKNNDFSVPYKLGCEMEKKRLECAIMLKAAQSVYDVCPEKEAESSSAKK